MESREGSWSRGGPWLDFHSVCSGPMDRRQGASEDGLDIQVRGVEGDIALSLIFVSITQENEARFFS